MRLLLPVFLFFCTAQLWGQACMLPASMNVLRPDRCGIRYVESIGDEIHVILEFEKKARIITPENPNDVKGISVNLRGVYYLQYDRNGGLLSERRSFLQTGEIPDEGMVFGLNGQRGDLLESDLHLLSPAAYDSIPWAGAVRSHQPKAAKGLQPAAYYSSELNIDRTSKLVNLEVIKHVQDRSVAGGYAQESSSRYNLEMYDSCPKKEFWTSLYEPVTDAKTGYTTAMLNYYSKKQGNTPSEKRMRLVTFDSVGETAGQHDFNFETPMNVAYRDEITKKSGNNNILDKQIWVFSPRLGKGQEEQYGQYYYYCFDNLANVTTTSKIISRRNVFNSINDHWSEEGVLFISNEDHKINSCYISNDGEYEVFSTGDKLTELQELMASCTRNGRHAVSLKLHEKPEIFKDSTILMIYKVQENVGVGASMGIDNSSTMVNHGLTVIHMRPNGKILAAKYFPRPKNAESKAPVVLGPIERNAEGLISFYAQEQTTSGSYPVLYTVRRGNVSALQNDKGATASPFIYYDSDEAIVGYFGVTKDPEDPRISMRTVEILIDED